MKQNSTTPGALRGHPKAIAILLLMLAAFFVTSCGGGSPKSATDTATERLIVNECVGKPWVNTPPEADSRFIYFVGKSGKFATEKGARANAMVDVTEQFVKYTGVKVSTVHEYMQVSYGLASQVQDATTSERKRAESRAEAFVSRIKAKEWCNERYQQVAGERVIGRIYLATLLARVPRDEVANVRNWQKNREKIRLAKIQENRDTALRQAQNFHNAALKAEGEGLVVSALESILAAARSLKAARDADPKGEVAGRPKPPAPDVATLRTMETRITTGITLNPDRPHRTIEPGAPPESLTVLAVYTHQGRRIPIGGLPVIFLANNRLLRTAQTNLEGKASLPMGVMNQPGQYTFIVRVARGNLKGRITPTAAEAFAGLQANFQVAVRQKGMEEKARDLVSMLEKDVGRRRVTVVVENFTFEDTGQAGPFINRFKEALNTALVKSPKFQVKPPKSRQGLTRGFSVVAADSPVTMAYASGSEGVLYGRYSRQGNRVRVRANLKNTKNVLVASSSVIVNAPPELPLTPANSGTVTAASADLGDFGKNNDFRLDLWVDKGDGATYLEGEKLFVNIRASRDCYLKLVYVVAGGQRIVIFPNAYDRNTRIKAGRVYQIPNAQSTFDFVIEPPFGAEMLIAFASTQPFPPDNGRELGGGMIELQESLRVVARKHRRGVGVKARQAKFAEKRVVLTTSAR